MKKFLTALFTALALVVGVVPAVAADAANDLILSQRKTDNSGSIQRNVPATAAITSGSLSSFQDSIGLGPTSSPTFNRVTSTVATGTAPFTVASTTLVANLHAATADTATSVTNVGVTDDNSTNATMYPTWVTANTGNLPIKVSSTKLTFNPSTGIVGLPDAGGITGLGALNFLAGGSNKSITLTPSGTGVVAVGLTGIAFGPTLPASITAASNGAITMQAGGNTNQGVNINGQGTGQVSVAGNLNVTLPTGVSGTVRLIGDAGFSKGFATRTGSTLRWQLMTNSTAEGGSDAGSDFDLQAYNDAGSAFGVDLRVTRATGVFSFGRSAKTLAAWGATGSTTRHPASTATDSSTAGSGTATLATFHSWAANTVAASNSTVTVTDAFNLYAVGPVAAGTNITAITRSHTLGIVDSTSSTTPITGGLIVATTVGTSATSVGIGGGNITAGGNIDTTSGEIRSAGNRVNYNLAAYGTGTVYTLTNTAAAVAFGTTSPSITIDKAGTYLIQARIQLAYTGATVVAETATVKLRRTNNTAADLTSGSTTIDLPVATTLTYTYGTVQIPPVVYQTSNTNDIVTIFANVSATLGAGTITAEVGGTNIVVVRLY